MVLAAIKAIACYLRFLSEVINQLGKDVFTYVPYKAVLFVFFSIISTSPICFALNEKTSLVRSFDHGDLHERIQQVTKEISVKPDSAFLFFKRGKLYFEHKKFEAAISDLDTAATLNYHGTICNLIYAKSYQQLNQGANAMKHIEEILHTDSFNVNALKIKGTLLLSQKEYKAAANQFELMIKHARKRLPENYLLAAKAWEADTLDTTPVKAIAILKKGIEDLGPLYIFHREMVFLFMKYSLFEEALEIQEKIIGQAKRKEKPYYEAALISLQTEKPELAEAYLNNAAAAIKALPPRLKTISTIKELSKNISKLLLK